MSTTMRVEILKPVMFRGEIKRSGTLEVSDTTGNHWIAHGAARVATDQLLPLEPSPPTKAPAVSGKKGF